MKYISLRFFHTRLMVFGVFVSKLFFLLSQRLVNQIRGKKTKHLIFSAVPGMDTTDLVHWFIASSGRKIYQTDQIHQTDKKAFLLKSKNMFGHDIIVTQASTDILNNKNELLYLAQFRDLCVIYFVADPRLLLCVKNNSKPEQYAVGMDQSLSFANHSASYTGIGISHINKKFDEFFTSKKLNFLLVKSEEFHNSSEKMKKEFEAAIGINLFENKAVFSTKTTGLNNSQTQVYNSTNVNWKSPSMLSNVALQYSLYQDIDQISIRWGYDKLVNICKQENLVLPLIKEGGGTIVAFHTDDELYTSEANRMRRSVERFNLKLDMTVVPSKDKWVHNCAMKPEILLEARKRIRGPILYLDVDAFMHQDPWGYLEQYDGDMAVYISPEGELVSATIYLADTENCIRILEKWLNDQLQSPDVWDQKILQDIMDQSDKSADSSFSIQRLPQSFCKLFNKNMPFETNTIYIEQLQASRSSVKKWGFNKAPAGSPRMTRIEELVDSLPVEIKNVTTTKINVR